MANFVRHSPCPNCGSKDNLAIYDDGSYFCFSHCGYKSISKEYKEELDKTKSSRSGYPRSKPTEKDRMTAAAESLKSTKPAITEEENLAIKARTSIAGKNFRGIRDDIYKYFGVRHSFDEETGEVDEQYYPTTQEGQLVGYKIREVPKNFRGVAKW